MSEFIKAYILSAVTASATERGGVDLPALLEEAKEAWELVSGLAEPSAKRTRSSD